MFRIAVSLVLSLVVAGALLDADVLAQTASRPAAPALEAQPAVVVNLNTATSAELQRLPGIGIRTAERIIQFRDQHGPFKKIEELMNVQGVGEKTFLRLRPQLTVAATPAGAVQR